MALRSHPVIIFLDRNGFLLYQDFLPNVWQFPFSEDLVLHLEVVNNDQLVNFIWSFLQTNKIMASSLIIVLSDSVVFQKDLSLAQGGQAPEAEDQEKEIQRFLENVPFEHFMAKVVGNTRIVATNKELVEAIILPFKKLGCIVEAVVPSFLYSQTIDFSLGITRDAAKTILQNPDLLKMGNMLVDQKETEIKQERIDNNQHEASLKEKPKNTRQIVLIAIFVFLLIILAIVYFTMGDSSGSPNPTVNNTPQTFRQATPPTLVPALTSETLSSPSANLKNTKITVIANSQTEVIGSALKRLLDKLGLQDVVLSVAQAPNPARSSILFSKSVDNEIRQKVTEEVKKILPDVSVQESQNMEDLTISITVGSGL